jgi:glutaredoxin-like YruB-family protein
MKEVKIYSTPMCPYCTMAKDFFKKSNIPYTDFDVASDAEKREEMIEKSGQMGVPVIDIDGEIVIGFDEKKISKLLGI